MKLNDSSIRDFWYLFEEIAKEIIADSNGSEIVEYVDSLVRSIGDYDWEFGPSTSHSFYFALSPNMRIDLLDQVDYIVSLAPNIDGWEIISCKPRKPEHIEEWEMLNEKGEKITINTANWKCVIYEFPDGKVDMDIVLDNVNGNDETKHFAVDIHLCNILGERKYIQRVNAIYIVEQFESNAKNHFVLVNDLDNYI